MCRIALPSPSAARMRLCCKPRCAPAIVRPQAPRAQTFPSSIPQPRARLQLAIGLPIRRFAAKPPAPPSSTTTPPPPPPPSSSQAAPPSTNADGNKQAEDEAPESVPLDAPQPRPAMVWEMTPITDNDPHRWWTYEPVLPARTKSNSPFDILANDHRRILHLAHLLRYESDMRTKEVLLWRLHKEVIFHDILEKRVLYPIFRTVAHKTDPADTQYTRVKREQKDVRWALRRLKKYKDPRDPLLGGAVNSVIHKLKVHFYEEETKMFPLLDQQLPMGVQTWMRIQLRFWSALIRFFGPFAKRSRRPPWDKISYRLWSLWHWRWGR